MCVWPTQVYLELSILIFLALIFKLVSQLYFSFISALFQPTAYSVRQSLNTVSYVTKGFLMIENLGFIFYSKGCDGNRLIELGS